MERKLPLKLEDEAQNAGTKKNCWKFSSEKAIFIIFFFFHLILFHFSFFSKYKNFHLICYSFYVVFFSVLLSLKSIWTLWLRREGERE
jgi:hypothetical protein